MCDEAKSMLNAAGIQRETIWQEVDIADDPILVEEYGIRIPVLRHLASGSELCWPFTLRDLQAWLTERECTTKQ